MKARDTDVLAVMRALAGVPSNATPDMFRVAMNRALARLGEKFHFKSLALVSLNPEDWSIQQVFTAQGQGAAVRLVRDFVSDLQGMQCSSLEPALLRSVYSVASLCQVRYIQLKQNPKAVASIVKPHDRLMVMLVAECRSAYRKTLADSQVLQAATELLALAMEKHARFVELEELARCLEEAQRAQLAGGIAHELNNNLTAIMGYAEMVTEAVLPDSQTHAYVEEILDAGKRAKLVIDRILTPDRMRKNTMTPFNAVDATAAILPALRIGLIASVRLHIDLPDADLTVVGSPGEFQQVLIDLCKDAGEAVGGGGQLRLAVEAVEARADLSLSHGQVYPRKYVRISIIDVGGEFGGSCFPMGVGQGGRADRVSTVHKVAQSLKGVMHMHSILGEGAHLELLFPCVNEPATPIKSGFAAGGNRPGKGERVAMIDPDRVSRSMWEERAAALGYEPLGFPEISALVDWCFRHGLEPDAVLVHMDGRSWPADASEMEADLSAGVAWTYVNDGITLSLKEPRLVDQPSVVEKPVNLDSLASAIPVHLAPVSGSRPG
jgi:nitrogen-specific signal transduction histidine kinase